MNADRQGKGSFMTRLATFIVDKRNLIFLVILIGIIFSAFSRNWVRVESDLITYLPDGSEAKLGMELMETQFTTFGTAQFMVANVSLDEAQALADKLAALRGVQSVAFDGTAAHYRNVAALFSVTFDADARDDACLDALARAEAALEGYDVYLSTSLGNKLAETINAEVSVIMVLVAFIVTGVLLLTSQTWAEVPVLLITFVVGMVLNLGTNFLLGTISFVSNSVTSILQLALSLDYAIIFCNRFKEEHQTLPTREAVILALSKAIPEIFASSLTTVGGLAAMLFMEFRIGPDMGVCLIKSIFFALFAVFFLMPGLLLVFAPAMDKTVHRGFVPKIPFVGRYAYATRHAVPLLFALVILAACSLSQRCPYAYGYAGLETPRLNETQIAERMIEESFGSPDMLALVVPAGSYESEADILAQLETMDGVTSCMGLANIEAMDGYTLTDRLTPRQFSELADLDYEAALLVYTAYAADTGEYGRVVGGISTYSVPLMDMFLFVSRQIEAGFVTLESAQREQLADAAALMTNARRQLQGKDYSRMLLYLELPKGGESAYRTLDAIRALAQRHYPDGKVYVVGDLTSEYDFEKSFRRDNVVVSIVSILIVLAVLLFTFKSAGMPLLLILVIQGSIWINFAVPALTGSRLFFMSYLVVSSIQMGANIDYAIVIASRFGEVRERLSRREAIINTMNFAFPTILTSGTILTVSGTLIGQMTSEPTIAGIGQSLGRGTLISIFLVLFVLPQILLLGERVVEKTSFSMPSAVREKRARGRVRIEGLVHGEISGTVSGMVNAIVDGQVDVKLLSGTAAELSAEAAPTAAEGGGHEK